MRLPSPWKPLCKKEIRKEKAWELYIVVRPTFRGLRIALATVRTTAEAHAEICRRVNAGGPRRGGRSARLRFRHTSKDIYCGLASLWLGKLRSFEKSRNKRCKRLFVNKLRIAHPLTHAKEPLLLDVIRVKEANTAQIYGDFCEGASFCEKILELLARRARRFLIVGAKNITQRHRGHRGSRWRARGNFGGAR